MSIENADYIHQLDVTAPRPVDPISEGDNHLRLIKKLLIESFPSDLNGVIVPDVAGNAEKYLRVNEGGTAIEWHKIQLQTAGIIPFRSMLSYKNGNTIILGPGEYTHKNQSGTLSWTGNRELTINGPSGNFAYIYLNNSGTVTPSWSNSEPAWSNADRGWYLGDKRCIGAVPTGGGVVKDFYHDGGEYVSYASDEQETAYGIAGVNAWVNVHIKYIPSFASQCQNTWTLETDPGFLSIVTWYWRTWGSTGPGHWMAVCESGVNSEAHSVANIRTAVHPINQHIQYYASSTVGGPEYQLWTNGFYLPRGL